MKKRLGGITTSTTDENTNYLYLSGLLKEKYGPFYDRLVPVLEKNHIGYGLLPDTKDVWVKDFMPVQIAEERYIQFMYEPDHLMKYKKYRATISDAAGICGAVGVVAVKSDLVLDGGNLVRCGSKAILTSKIFRENPRCTETELLQPLRESIENRRERGVY
jgi:agmatine deiminase